jgi:hypothetical protein
MQVERFLPLTFVHLLGDIGDSGKSTLVANPVEKKTLKGEYLELHIFKKRECLKFANVLI